MTVHTIRKLRIENHNRHLFQIPRYLLSHINKMVITTLNEKELYLLFNLFSRFHVTNLKIKYCTCKMPSQLLRFHSLERLDITITSKENEDTVFNLILMNKDTLRKLKIGIYTGKEIDEQKLQRIIEENLRLEYIDIRGDLLMYPMIKPCTKYIAQPFVYVNQHINKLTYLVRLRLCDVTNHNLTTLLTNLLVVERLSLWGLLSNYDHVRNTDSHTYSRILHKYDDMDFSRPYDRTFAKNIVIKSTRLSFLFLHGFTIETLESHTIEDFVFEDVCVLKEVIFPKVHSMYIENMIMNPDCFHMNKFILPKLKSMSLLNCVIHEMYRRYPLTNINIQSSIIRIDMGKLIRTHRKLKNVLLYNNYWIAEYDKKSLIKYMKQRRISGFDNAEEW